jgi:toxin-antitoxin system PIN domain toxin
MSKLLDINAWLALFLEGHAQHAVARTWYEGTELLAGDLKFCRPTEMGLLRLLTQKKVMQACLSQTYSNESAAQFLADILRDEAVGMSYEVPGTRALWLALARSPQPSPNQWMDAYLAAMAITNDLQMVTFDQGFVVYESSGLNLQLLTD